MTKRRGTSGSTTLNCFSPPVMLATLTIEFGLATYALWRYKLNEITKLIVLLLVNLAIFQTAEYFVCTGYGNDPLFWSKVGFVAITTLPVFGIHAMHKLAGKPVGNLVRAAYGTMTGFIVFFLTYKYAFVGHQCQGNYVIFQLGTSISGAYSVYYYGWMFTSMYLGIKWANELKELGAKGQKKLETVRGLIAGYLVFIVPVALINTIKPETRAGIPSLLCGFAVLLALILGLYILPRVGVLKHAGEKHNPVV